MTTTSIDDDLDGPSIDADLCVEDVASLVFFLLMLKSQDLGDNKSGARILITKYLIIFILVHAPVHGHFLKGFHLDRGKGVPSFDEMMDIALVEVDLDDPTTNVRVRRALAIAKPTPRGY